MRALLLSLCIVLSLSSCLGPKTLQKKLNRNKYPIGYLHDSPINIEKLNISISPIIVDSSDSTYLTQVIKDDGHFLYLVIMYDYHYDMTVRLGKNSLQPSITESIEKSFIKESERSGIYKVRDTSASKNHLAKIEVLDYQVSSKYQKNGSAFGSYQQFHINVHPSNGYIKMKLSVFDNEEKVLFTKEYHSVVTSNYLKSRSMSEREINTGLMHNMTETLGLCIKENISQIVSDINKTIL
jgi:hypothetical protein